MIARSFVLLLLGTLLSGCMTTKVLRATDLPNEPALPTVMVSGMVELANPQSQAETLNVVDVVASVANNTRVDEFGATVQGKLARWLAKQGLAVSTDAQRVKALQTVDWGEAANALTVLTGTWVNPEGATMRVAHNTLFRGYTLTKVAEKLGTPSTPEGYLFTVVTVFEDTEWLVLRRPLLRVSVIVADQNGREVLRARGWGSGRTTPLVVDRTETNLGTALDEAIRKLEAAEVKPLD
jgi:hypothetical protein